ncbi:MAG: hypothetical protein SCK57_02080 [Bacillota bacterium]|nr:hypothetical protein [Bacillota bacterium]MDW7676429.1 hypothetical protein [Bacillota bacterium]
MVKSMNQQQQEEYLNDFIDALIMECKPVPPSPMSQELSGLMETVRAVKRLRSERELLPAISTHTPVTENVMALQEGKQRKASIGKSWMKWASIAAAVFLIVGVVSQMQRPQPATEMAEDAPAEMRSMEMAGAGLGGIVAMAESFEQLENYQGVLEIHRKFEDHGWTETVDITYAKPNQFYAVTTREDGTTYTQIYDGEGQMISFLGDGTADVTVQPMSPEMLEMYLTDYHVGSLLNEIQSAPEVLEAGIDRINGRGVMVYEYRYDPSAPWHRAWVDQQLQLPVKVEANFANGDQLIREFTQLAVDVPLEPTYFAFDLSRAEDVYYAEVPVFGSGDEQIMAAAEAPPEEEGLAMFSLEAMMPQVGVAALIRQIDSYYVELRLIDVPAPYQEFKLSEELREAYRDKKLQIGSLFTVSYEVTEGEIPVVTAMEPTEQARLEAQYRGRADSSFAEFAINDQILVIALSESVKPAFENFDRELNERPEGIHVMVVIEASDFSFTGIITAVERIDE